MEAPTLEEKAIVALLHIADLPPSSSPHSPHPSPSPSLKPYALPPQRCSLSHSPPQLPRYMRNTKHSNSNHLVPLRRDFQHLRHKKQLKIILEKMTEHRTPQSFTTSHPLRHSYKTVSSSLQSRISQEMGRGSPQQEPHTLECLNASRQQVKELVQAKIAQKIRSSQCKKALLKTKLHISHRAADIRKLRNSSERQSLRADAGGKQNSHENSLRASTKIRLRQLVI